MPVAATNRLLTRPAQLVSPEVAAHFAGHSCHMELPKGLQPQLLCCTRLNHQAARTCRRVHGQEGGYGTSASGFASTAACAHCSTTDAAQSNCPPVSRIMYPQRRPLMVGCTSTWPLGAYQAAVSAGAPGRKWVSGGKSGTWGMLRAWPGEVGVGLSGKQAWAQDEHQRQTQHVGRSQLH